MRTRGCGSVAAGALTVSKQMLIQQQRSRFATKLNIWRRQRWFIAVVFSWRDVANCTCCGIFAIFQPHFVGFSSSHSKATSTNAYLPQYFALDIYTLCRSYEMMLELVTVKEEAGMPTVSQIYLRFFAFF